VLFLALGGAYGTAAFVGSMLGGVTNFTINRHWAFGATRKRLGPQAIEYALASLATYAALQTCLFVLVEWVHVGGHVAWVPAKIVSWLFVSYPVQRFLVFADRRAAVLMDASGATGDGDFFAEGIDAEPEAQRIP
jgi:putative flippase GtrA